LFFSKNAPIAALIQSIKNELARESNPKIFATFPRYFSADLTTRSSNRSAKSVKSVAFKDHVQSISFGNINNLTVTVGLRLDCRFVVRMR